MSPAVPVVVLLVLVVSASAAPASDAVDLTALTLEELMEIEVVTVSKHAQRRDETAAAIHVITRDDIRRSGATSIADALRLVPGLHVARVNTNIWAIGAREMGSRFSNRLLVLMDGRSVYTPLFSGVYWDAQDTMLEDVERIEVIRGPGASIWGANAVNGVVNVITRRAEQTPGALVTSTYGSEERGTGGLRLGGRRGDHLHHRLYGKHLTRDASILESGAEAFDGWNAGRGGMRLDWQGDAGVAGRPGDALMVIGNIHAGHLEQSFVETIPDAPYSRHVDTVQHTSGLDLLARWQRHLSPDAELTLQAYYDRTERDDTSIHERRQNVDVELRTRVIAAERHEVVGGLGLRETWDAIRGSFYATYTPDSRREQLLSLFMQDEITLARPLRLTLGTKYESHSRTGGHFQPSLHVVWLPAAAHRIWGAVSRAYRTPSRSDTDIRFNALVQQIENAPDVYVSIFGNGALRAEQLTAYEVGYKGRLGGRLSVDVAAFYNDYADGIGFEAGRLFVELQPQPSHLVYPLEITNDAGRTSYGAEVTLEAWPTHWWRLRTGYSYLSDETLGPNDGSPVESLNPSQGAPPHLVHLWSSMTLPRRVELDGILRVVDALTLSDVDGYATVDLRVGWTPVAGLELALIGRSLLEPRHREYDGGDMAEIGYTSTEVERAVFARVVWRFP